MVFARDSEGGDHHCVHFVFLVGDVASEDEVAGKVAAGVEGVFENVFEGHVVLDAWLATGEAREAEDFVKGGIGEEAKRVNYVGSDVFEGSGFFESTEVVLEFLKGGWVAHVFCFAISVNDGGAVGDHF